MCQGAASVTRTNRLSGDIQEVLKRPPTSFRRFVEDAMRK